MAEKRSSASYSFYNLNKKMNKEGMGCYDIQVCACSRAYACLYTYTPYLQALVHACIHKPIQCQAVRSSTHCREDFPVFCLKMSYGERWISSAHSGGFISVHLPPILHYCQVVQILDSAFKWFCDKQKQVWRSPKAFGFFGRSLFNRRFIGVCLWAKGN